MILTDILYVFQWWIMLFAIGIVFLPLTTLIFNKFPDKGYIFSKIIGIALISYAVFVLGFLKIAPFTETTITLIIIVFLILNIVFVFKYFQMITSEESIQSPRRWPNGLLRGGRWKILLFEEILFVFILWLWSYIHAHNPSIQGLEKFMDFGFINSILRSTYFPPADMWFTPLPINYYYFGHLTTAVLTKISFISSNIAYNLMLATITSLSFVATFSIGLNLIAKFTVQSSRLKAIIGGLLSAFILNFGGNLHSIYLFFAPYSNDDPVPFWQLVFSPNSFPNSYWYPNATRFIENTIHEFPIYSSVVSDLHGHFMDIPFVLLTIAVLFSLFQNVILSPDDRRGEGSKILRRQLADQNDMWILLLISFLLAVLYMTNAWDGIIYFLLSSTVIGFIFFKQKLNPARNKERIAQSLGHKVIFYLLLLGFGFLIFSLPFNINFKPFASGIGVLCAPSFLTNIGNLGPFLFEPNHCQHSPLWQLFVLYGFFYFWAISFLIFLKLNARRLTLNASDIFVLILILFSTLLIIIPEFVYVKDIYPAHYRANTMFKLAYQAFIMLSISSGYIIIRLLLNRQSLFANRYSQYFYWIIGLLVFILIALYPYFAIRSYFGDFQKYSGLDGTKYLASLYPDDYRAINWITENVENQPVILEAQGDSYTDYARVSSNTGLPTVLGWTVHEWLWRGTYDIPAPRIEDVRILYETEDLEAAKNLIKKYNISLVFIGDLEVEKYENIYTDKFDTLGKIIFQKNNTKIYKIENL